MPTGSSDSGEEFSEAVEHHEAVGGDDGESTDDDGSSVDSAEDVAGTGGTTQKKRRRKKKNRRSGSNSGSEDGSGGNRFSEALATAHADNDAWISLNNANLHDRQLRKLIAALENNQSVTEIDLSNNALTDAGVQELAAALERGTLPELISIDLRGNNTSSETDAKLLQTTRKDLSIKAGALASDLPDTSADGAPAGEDANPLVNKYFGMDEGEGVPIGPSASGTGQPGEDGAMWDPAEVAAQNWKMITDALAAEGNRIPVLSVALSEVNEKLREEMDSLHLPLESVELSELKPHLRHACENVAMLDDVLSIVPNPLPNTYSSQLVPAVGSHRFGAARVVCQLLRAGAEVCDVLIAQHGLLQRITHLALDHDNHSALQGVVLLSLRQAFESSYLPLWGPLFERGLGVPGETCAPLHERLAKICTDHVDIPIGKRPSVLGFSAMLATEMQSLCTETPDRMVNEGLKQILESNESWMSFIQPGGPLAAITEVQNVHLAGHKPARPEAVLDDGGDLGALSGARLISGRELLAMLQGMQGMGTQIG